MARVKTVKLLRKKASKAEYEERTYVEKSLQTKLDDINEEESKEE